MCIILLLVLISYLVCGVECKSTSHSNALWLIKGGASPASEEMKPFYALGINIARQVGSELKTMLSEDEIDAMISGYRDSLMSVVSNTEEKKILSTYGQSLNTIVTQRATDSLNSRKDEGNVAIAKFMKENKNAKKTGSGLVILNEVDGTGDSPTEESIVEVHYHGTLMDGTVFDSSKLRGETVKFPLAKVIQGWKEGVQLMKTGGSAVLYIPSELAYGDTGSPPVIPPGSTLKFEIELISFSANDGSSD